jgi:hypothetical protein
MKPNMKPWHVIALAIPFASLVSNQASAGNEVMTDRCSAEVAIVPSYGDKPNTPGTILLQRGPDGRTDWTPPFTVRLGDGGRIRWWCHSTKGNWLDAGTWRVEDVNPEGMVKCLIGVGSTVAAIAGAGSASSAKELTACPKALNLKTSAWEGWTPERSRCDNRSTRVRARLGPDRLLQIECLGR